MGYFYRLSFFAFFVSLGVLAYFGYPIIKERHFQPAPAVLESPDLPGNKDSDSFKNPEIFGKRDDYAEHLEEQAVLEQAVRIKKAITPDDCETECRDFSETELEYCQEVCGLANHSNQADDCEKLIGIKKDYCFKNQAITQIDSEICFKIKDQNIQSSCKNRILEEEMDENMRRTSLPE